MTTVRDLNHFHVNADGSSTQLIESATRIETASAVRRLGERKIFYNGSHEVVDVLEAYTLQPDGTKVQLEPDQIRTQDDNTDGVGIYSDSKVKLLIYPKIQVGSVLYYKAKAIQHTADFPNNFSWSTHFSPFYVWEGVEVSVTHDPGIALRFSTKGMTGGLVPSHPGDARGALRYQFRFKQEQYSPPEIGVVALRDFAPHFAVSSFATYADVAQAYQQRARPKAEVTQAIEVLAKQLTAKDQTAERKTRSLYNWVSKNIRYLGVYVGAGGYVPHAAQSILDNRYGDCKDHVTLLEALLRAVGIESSPALINSGNTYKLPELPTPGVFDHVITYVPSLNLYLDSTSEFTPFGLLPASNTHKPVLLTADGKTNRTPKVDVAKDFTETHTSIKLHMDGSISGSSKSLMHGHEQISSRVSQARYKDKAQEDIVNQLLERFLESGSGKIESPDPKDLDTPWYVNAEFKLDSMVNVPGPSALTFPVGLAQGNLRWLSTAPANLQRRYPDSCFTKRHIEHTTLEIPAGVAVTGLPGNVDFKVSELTYTAQYIRKENTLEAKRELVIQHSERYCQPHDEVDWLALTNIIKRDIRSQVFIR